jgi:hypothetical protein
VRGENERRHDEKDTAETTGTDGRTSEQGGWKWKGNGAERYKGVRPRSRSEQTGYYTSQGTSDAVSRVLQEAASLARRYLRVEGGWS